MTRVTRKSASSIWLPRSSKSRFSPNCCTWSSGPSWPPNAPAPTASRPGPWSAAAGRKPWRQKGTGRARAGSTRSPLWRGGAVVHGPEPRDYTFKVNRKVRQLALRMALSAKLGDDSLVLVEGLLVPEIKTKHMVKVVSDFGLRKALIVLPDSDNNLELSARNIPGIKVVRQDMLNVYDVLRHDHVIMLKDAAFKVQERLGHGVR